MTRPAPKSRVNRILFAASAVVTGLAIGAGSAIAVLNNGKLLGAENAQGWFTNEKAGQRAADPYTRGIIARVGILVLDRSQTIYFMKHNDERHRQLREGCVYELSGVGLPARWWSITIYAEDEFLPVNGHDAAAVGMTGMTLAPDGGWKVRIAPTRAAAANWLSSKNAGNFSLGIRMYNPTDAARDDQRAITFPVLRTVACERQTA